MRRVARVCAVVSTLIGLSCGGPAPENQTQTPDVISAKACTGKCDGFDKIVDLFQDMKNVSLDDLVALGAPHATDAINDALSISDYARLELAPTTLYASKEEIFGQTTVHDLESLSAGLTQRLGERDFATRMVTLRRDIAAREDSLFAESRFSIGANLGESFGFDAGPGVGSVGFRAGAEVEVIAVSKFKRDDQIEAIVRQPLQAVKETRGFVLPRSVEDYRKMEPGEALAMRAEGGLGLNVGAGVPFLLASVGTAFTVHARLSLAARAAMEGKLDVQLLRGAGDVLYVDVGLSKARIRSLEASVTPGFGLDVIPDVDVDLGVTQVKLAELANDAIRDQLQKHINVRADIGASDEDGRLRVARFEIDLSQSNSEEVTSAIAQLTRGDLRLAQALARRGAPGVRQLIDMTKEYHHHDFRAGFQFLSMRFYLENGFDTGQITVDTEEGSQTLLFTDLQEKRGFFFTDRESSWRTLVSIEQRGGQDVRGQVNVRHIMREGQESFSRDELLDHTNAMLATLVSAPGLVRLIDAADAVANISDDQCRDPGSDASFSERRTYRDCLLEAPMSPEVQGAMNTAREVLDLVVQSDDIRSGFGPDGRQGTTLVRELYAFELQLAAAGYDSGENVVPDGQVVSELRISNEGVHELMRPENVDRFMSALEMSLRVMSARRTNEDLADKASDLDDKIEDKSGRFAKIRDGFVETVLAFEDLEDAAQVSFGGEAVGNQANLILLGADREVDLRTIAEHKGALLERFIPDIIDIANGSIFSGLGEPEVYVVGYALAGAVSPQNMEWMYSWTFDDDERLSFEPFQIYARGASEFIDAGIFDLEVLLGAKP